MNGRLSRHGVNATIAEPVCFEWPMRTLTDEEIRSAMLSSLPAGAEIDLVSSSRSTVPPGPLEFPIDALRNGVWRGFVLYDSVRRFPVTVQVTARVPWTRVIATEPIRAGERITEGRVQLTSGMGEPSRGQFLENPQEAVGRVAKRFIRAGAPVEAAALGEANVVARGDSVSVEVVSGRAMLRFQGIAEAPAAAGAVVPVRNPDTGKIVHARVDDRGRARLDLSEKEN
jgi:flagella basal body P-ring formation protein FlgA